MNKLSIRIKMLFVLLVILGVFQLTTRKENAQPLAEEAYDVVVIGGEPEGVAAAISAARNNAKTLLIEKRADLGGLFTYGMLNYLDIPLGEDGQSVSKGIFTEWHQLVGGNSAFGIEDAKVAFKKLITEEEDITFSPETIVTEAIVEKNQVIGVKIKNKLGERIIKGKTFIDATQDADFAAMAKVPYFIGAEDLGLTNRKMSATMIIHLKNVNWNQIKQTAKSGKFGEAAVTDTVAWGFPDVATKYEPKDKNTRLRALNLAKVDDDYFINALQIFQVDELDEQSKQLGLERGKKETDCVLAFLKAEFPGFEQAEIKSYPPELYVRETRHILAEYQLPMVDVWTNKDHWDGIGFGAYPIDVQAQVPRGQDEVYCTPKKYAIPFRSLVPLQIDGLLVVGRSAGYSSLAAGSARVVSTGMTTGEAAGVAAALVNETNMSFRQLSKDRQSIGELRERLVTRGAYVEQFQAGYPYEGEWYDGAIRTLINYGLIQAGYSNELHVEDEAASRDFIRILDDGISRAVPNKYLEFRERLEQMKEEITALEGASITRDDAAKYISQLIFSYSKTDAWGMLINEGLIDKQLANNLNKNKDLLNKEMFAMNAAVINYFKKASNS